MHSQKPEKNSTLNNVHMADDKYNNIYNKLVENEDDVAGMFAYSVYKRHKISFVEDIKKSENRCPNDVEIKAFYITTCMDQSINGYKKQGQAVASKFLANILDAKITKLEKELSNGFISEKINELKETISPSKKPEWYLKNILANFGSNIFTIMFIGIIILGYNFLNKINNKAEILFGVSTITDDKKEDIKKMMYLNYQRVK